MEYRRHPERTLRHFLVTPFIYGLSIPLVLFDLCLEVYHHACFPAYGIPYVDRSAYIRLDRQKLAYLGFLDKLNCAYCGYANGLVRYAAAIGAETERYWCAIRQKEAGSFVPPPHQEGYLPYGDEKAYKDFDRTAGQG